MKGRVLGKPVRGSEDNIKVSLKGIECRMGGVWTGFFCFRIRTSGRQTLVGMAV
jgi:hypothetical protein